MRNACDILVVGGGPAGATAAALLAAGGRHVIVCETKPFPRHKVCGEFMAPASREPLARLGLLAWFDAAAGAPIRRVRALVAGAPDLAADLPAGPDGQFPRALRRDVLDEKLLARAAELGAQILQPAHVIEIAGSARAGFLAKTTAGTFAARAVILAHGSARRGSMAPDAPIAEPRGHICFKTHLAHCTRGPETIVLGGARGMYAGLVQTSGAPARHTLAFVVSRERLLRLGSDPAAHVGALCRESPAFARLLRDAAPVGDYLASGPLAPGVRTVYHDGRFFVGNAAGEVHALVGEGITLALRGGALLADTILARGLGDVAGTAYESAWRREFSLRYHAANLFAGIAMRPAVATHVAALLDRHPALFRACVRSTSLRAKVP
jgi:flavin-dependent dehydrogenase